MAKHTPGPWVVSRKFEVGPLSNADDQSSGMISPLADVYGERREEDARLISAAPTMLEALLAAEKHFGPFADITINGQHAPEDVRVVTLIRAAIAKAEGN